MTDRAIDAALILVGALGWAVLISWLFGWERALYVLEGHVTMKPKTSLGFICAASLLFWQRRAQATLAGTFAVLLLLVLGAGMNNILVEPPELAHHSVAPGVPSIMTVLAFFAVAGQALLRILGMQRRARPLAGWFCFLAGSMALLGYLAGIPLLTFEVAATSSAMAIHTAMGFAILGGCMLSPSFPKDRNPAV